MKKIEKTNTPNFIDRTFKKLSNIDKILENKIDKILLQLINILRYVFIITIIL